MIINGVYIGSSGSVEVQHSDLSEAIDYCNEDKVCVGYWNCKLSVPLSSAYYFFAQDGNRLVISCDFFIFKLGACNECTVALLTMLHYENALYSWLGTRTITC